MNVAELSCGSVENLPEFQVVSLEQVELVLEHD